MTALREIRILQLLKHDNIVNLVEICRSKGKRKGNAHVRFLCREGGRERGREGGRDGSIDWYWIYMYIYW